MEAITDFRVHLDRYMIPKILKQLIFGCLSLDPIKRPSFDVASSQLRSNEKLIASFEGGAPLPDYEEESYILDDGDAKKKGKDGKGSRSLLSGFYDSNLVSRFTANSGRFGDTKAPRKSNNEGAGGEYVSNYNRDFDFTGKKKKRKKIVIAILVGLLILLIIGLGVGLKYLLASAASASTTSTSFDGGSSVSYNSISTVTPTTLKSRSSSTTTTSTTKIPLPAETLPLLLPVNIRMMLNRVIN